jgi:DNA-binding response OmpR family regulator
MQPRILLVDDERTARLSLAEILRMEGFEVVAVEGGREAILFLRAQDFDVVLCDLKMPEVGGLDVLAACREHRPATEFVLMTAYGSLDTAVEALRFGASDYLLKPALPETILESITKVLEKRHKSLERESLMGMLTDTVAALQEVENTLQPAMRSRILQQGGLVLDLDKRTANRDGDALSLTPTEFELLVHLMEAGGRPVSSEELVAHVHGYLSDVGEASALIRVHISRLRRKLERDPTDPQTILTIRGMGYAFGDAD